MVAWSAPIFLALMVIGRLSEESTPVVRTDQPDSSGVTAKKRNDEEVKEVRKSGKLTKLVWKGTEVSLGMTYRDFEKVVPQSLFSSVRASDGVFVVFSPDGMETEIKEGHRVYSLSFSNSLGLVRIDDSRTK